MKLTLLVILGMFSILPLFGEISKKKDSVMNPDPEIINLKQISDKPIKLKVIKQAPVYSDKKGNYRIGFLKTDQLIELEEMTDKAYRVRGKGTRYGIVGWVAPWAFSHPEEDFVEKLKKLYERQVAVNEIIKNKGVAIGMTVNEVAESRGKPTKKSTRLTAKGEEGTWEFLDLIEVKHYTNRVDPVTNQIYRQLSHITQEEKGKTVIEFKDGLVTALEESENNAQGNVKIIVPPLIFGW